MEIVAGILSVLVAAVVASSALNSRKLTRAVWVRRLVLLVGFSGALIAGGVIWFGLIPGTPLDEGTLATAGDALTLSEGEAGRLSITLKPPEGDARSHGVVNVQLHVRGEAGKRVNQTRFQIGDTKARADDEKAPAEEFLATNVRIPRVGADARVELASMSPPDRGKVEVAYYPDLIPLPLLVWVLFGLAALAGAFEGAAASSYRRSFFTVSLAGAATLAWLLQDGMAPDKGIWDVAIRVGYALASGAIAGTLGPPLLGFLLPSLPGEEDAEGASPPAAGSSTEGSDEEPA